MPEELGVQKGVCRTTKQLVVFQRLKKTYMPSSNVNFAGHIRNREKLHASRRNPIDVETSRLVEGIPLQTTSRHCLHQCGFKPIVSHRLSASISTLGLHASETSFCRCVAWLLVETTQSGTIDFIPHQRKGCFGEVCAQHPLLNRITCAYFILQK